jgi:choline dehydrogenase
MRNRPNLTLQAGVQVTRSNIPTGGAPGGDSRSDGHDGRLLASREVILCAGVVHSPSLLMLSGIGDGGELARLGIEVKVDRPAVGRNLQDHVDVTVRQSCPLPITESMALRPDQKALIGLQWILFKTGRGATNHFEVGGYVETRQDLDRPNIQLCFMPLLVSYDGAPALSYQHGYQVSVMLLQPSSRGAVELASPDPLVAPKLTFNYLSEEDEVVQLAEGIQAVREILSHPAMERFRGTELAPAVGSAELVGKFIRATAKSTHHPGGTCRMGVDGDAVVDPQGRVRGVRGLRVADASIFPKITSGNINAPTVMLAEKISDMIVRGGMEHLHG